MKRLGWDLEAGRAWLKYHGPPVPKGGTAQADRLH